MSESLPEPKSRKPRADSLRNREHILTVARQAFSARGADVTFEEIVRLSGIGVGTMYRHFPTRDALIEAVYRAEVEKLAESARELVESEPPMEALRQWLFLFIDMMAAKMAIKEALNSMVGGTTQIYAATGEILRASITLLADRAVASGEIRLSVEPFDLLRAVGGVASGSPAPNWEDSARRLVDILIAGVRVSKT